MLTDGRWPAAGATAEVVIDHGLSSEEGIELGDTMSVATRGGVFALEVVGYAIPTSRAPYPIWDTARVFVAPATVDLLGGGSPGYYFAGYRLDDRERTASFMEWVAITMRATPPPIFSGRSWVSIRDGIQEENQGATLFLGAFAGFTLLA